MDHIRILEWADRQLGILKGDIERFESAQAYPLIGNREGTAGEYVLRFDKSHVQPIPDDWVFQIGDVIHNMRVSLDYLAFSIVKPPPDDDIIRRVSFPIVRESKDWPGRAGHCLPGITDEIGRAFERLQPYHGLSGDRPEPLFVLDALENVHKHRHLLTAGLASTSMGYVGWGNPNFTHVRWGVGAGPLDDRAEVVRLRLINPTETEPNRKFKATVKVCFRKEGVARGLPVPDLLEYVRDHIRDVVFRDLKKFL